MPRPARWLRRTAGSLAALLGVWLLAWLAVPPLLHAQAQQRLSALLGRPVQIGDVSLAPWALSVTLHDLRIGPVVGVAGSDMLQVGRLHADLAASSLWRRAPVVEALQIERPVIHLTRLPGGALDIDDVMARLQPKPDEVQAPASRFALYNLELTGGRVSIDDRHAGLRHEVTDLRVDLPFVSNLAAHVAVRVQPRVAFRLDGSSFDTGATLLPFSDVRSGQLVLRIDDLDLARWAAYLPAASSPVRPTAGRLTAEITANFSSSEGQQPRLTLHGHARLSDVALMAGAAPGATPLAAWRRLDVDLQQVLPFERRVELGDVVLHGLRFTAERDAAGRLALARLADPPGAAGQRAEPQRAPPWQLRVKRVQLADSAVQWRDDATRPAAALVLSDVALEAGPLDTASPVDVPWRLAAKLAAADGSRPAALQAQGTAGRQSAQAAVDLQALDLSLLSPYLSQHLAVPMSGVLALTGRMHWSAGRQPRLQADIQQLRMADLRLGEGPSAAGWRRLTLANGRADLLGRTLVIGSLELESPQLALMRAADGTLDASRWLRSAAATAEQAPPATLPWRVRLGQLQVRAGRLRWADQTTVTPVALQVADLRLAASGLQWPLQGTVPARISLQAQVSDARPTEAGIAAPAAGRIDWSGTLAPQPLVARGALRVQRLPVHALAPYVSTGLQVVLAHADADWQGQVALQQQPQGLFLQADGDARLSDVQVQAPPRDGLPGDALLAWQDLRLDRLQLRLAPGAATQVSVQEAALSDFYSRLVITEQGRFNLRDVAAPPAGAPPAAAQAASEPAASPAGPVISVASTRLSRGRIDFADRFIRPNYSAELNDLNGSLGAISSSSTEMATLSLRGRVAGTALLDIDGRVNPIAKPLVMDLRAKATDLELSPLSPYSGRYAGYVIERGKLSMDVAYRIAPDGRLDASNRLVLNQLTFGEKVDSPDATQLPLTLAIALLKDRHGMIDLDLPVSGSINDPQFSVFGLVLKVLGNLLAKAVTAPFSLLSGGRDGADASRIEFVPGTDRMLPAAEAALDTVARALADRTGLQLTVSGSGDLASEHDALRAVALEQRLLAEHRRRAGPAAAGPTREEHAALLRRLYADTRLPDKPRNLVGLAKALPPQEMAERLQAVLPAGEEQLRELAQRRGTAVRDALLARGVPSERLFLAAPRLGGSSGAQPGAPVAELVLSAR